MGFNWLKNKKYPYLGGGERKSRIETQSVSEGWKNIKSELGNAFDYLSKKKRKKKEGDSDGSLG